MNDDIAIRVEHVSKKYCKSLKRSMLYGIQDIGRNMLGRSSHPEKLRKNEFWAIEDVSFEVKRGETLGIIGPNGAGKTTLLKMLNGIFWPDKGKITVKGRVGALIQVGAGFHPLLTGRENIYINAAILGMTKEEVDEKFDTIVNFADIGKFLDSPVKHYSSGMFVRLGFAVAIHCKPDLLLIDEILAVGDGVFRNKCYKKMAEFKDQQNVSIIMVSHDLLAIRKTCNMGLFLEHGKIQSYGNIKDVTQDYQTMILRLSHQQNIEENIPGLPYCTKEIEISHVAHLNNQSQQPKVFFHNETLRIRVQYHAKHAIRNAIFQISFLNRDNVHIAASATHWENIDIPSIYGENVLECTIEHLPFLLGMYYITIGIYDDSHNTMFDYWNGSLHNSYFYVGPNSISENMTHYTPLCYFQTTWKLNGRIL